MLVVMLVAGWTHRRRDDAGTAIPDNSKLAHCGGPGSSCDNQRIEFDSLGPIDPQNHENALLPGLALHRLF